MLFGNKDKPKKEKTYRWEPVVCDIGTLRKIMEVFVDIGLLRLDISYLGKRHQMGVISAWDKGQQSPHDHEFYLDGQKFKTLNEFWAGAMLENKRLIEASEPISILADIDEGNPKQLLKCLEPRKGKTPNR